MLGFAYGVIIDEFMRQIWERESMIDFHWQMFHSLPLQMLKEIFPMTYKKISNTDRGPSSWLLYSHQIFVAILGYLDHSIEEWNSTENKYSHREGAFILEAKIRELFQSRKSTKEQATQAKTKTQNNCILLERFSTPDPAQSKEINSIR
jgi:WD40 repeat protein